MNSICARTNCAHSERRYSHQLSSCTIKAKIGDNTGQVAVIKLEISMPPVYRDTHYAREKIVRPNNFISIRARVGSTPLTAEEPSDAKQNDVRLEESPSDLIVRDSLRHLSELHNPVDIESVRNHLFLLFSKDGKRCRCAWQEDK